MRSVRIRTENERRVAQMHGAVSAGRRGKQEESEMSTTESNEAENLKIRTDWMLIGSRQTTDDKTQEKHHEIFIALEPNDIVPLAKGYAASISLEHVGFPQIAIAVVLTTSRAGLTQHIEGMVRKEHCTVKVVDREQL